MSAGEVVRRLRSELADGGLRGFAVAAWSGEDVERLCGPALAVGRCLGVVA
ncbi:hypothetical protein [Amycolatopsis sp. NPDC098790]|uniref:hypothetical protein n=1 Tax=Amycolatopsis sp. NPDC098790 TaxID=3363939 RepID=UPI00381C2AB4